MYGYDPIQVSVVLAECSC